MSLKKAVSGQFLYFALNSVLSGFPITGFSGAISGRKASDGISGMIVLSGNIIELGGGMYRANLYDFDCSGDCMGYLFTASGAVARDFSVVTVGGMSGFLYPASGVNATVPPSSLSGVVANSGLFVTVPIASISGAIVNSGLFVTVPTASISGVVANSGLFTTVLPANLSGVVANSGLNVNADVIRWRTVQPNNLLASGRVDATFGFYTNVARSGTLTTVQLDAGAPTGTSGIFDGDLIAITAGSGQYETRRIAFYSASGIATVDKAFTVAPFANSIFYIIPDANPQSGQTFPGSGAGAIANSGLFVTVLPANLSGLIVNSGLFVTVPIATISGAIGNSGQFVTVPKETISGVVANSGLFVTATATVASGLFVTVPIESISGVIVNSGLFVTVPKATISGVIANSGLFVNATANVSSGIFVTVPPESISGVFATASLNSGQSVLVYSGQLSGQLVNMASGGFVTASLNSGQTTIAASGSNYLASGSIFPNTFSSGTATAYIPDRVIQRDFTGSSGLVMSGLSGRCLVNAGRKLTNKFDFQTSGFLTVYQEDDAIVGYRQAVTTQSGAEPITSMDTV